MQTFRREFYPTQIGNTHLGWMEVSLKKALLAALALSATVFEALPARAADNYQVTQVGTEVPTPGLRRTTFTVSSGPSPLETFHVVRVRQTSLSHVGDPP